MTTLAAIVLAFALSSCASAPNYEPSTNAFPCDCPSDLGANYATCGKQSAFCRARGSLVWLDCTRPDAPDPSALCK